ncbi:MAG: repair protein RadA protein [Microgenomates group bacterium GW2011_GWC1_43_13]|uniref:DNA repair protein RadA n=3 Tax=Candidatus Woeseibacteriota TaxID=1752722 RepID=A0A837IFG9_9BACT|nr:MAG: repair protein RadA protein [Microgenomates group bacterium GW2011_GWC1_43_13]KKT32949.1 MAG: repair protein RadA protein [Candidatus Woesebacteria bacterium GW2011_GWB1_44_11]KKT54533.1 MAG: repair protein RadA protein [Candidatus Woesebacteria bacterium GW2011_GWA1_44_23]OGM82193.1 MAG: DNA repair protein RadA [Candidatus Woesebacteria bacterium RIFOXYB1_FULL_42_36]OGM84585.1 MAG: DNA repair protein RadA [Candidatus Woesebacteria bacterium RIFOXYC1_FULL_43_18]OGM87695.1 MAG: DNA repa
MSLHSKYVCQQCGYESAGWMGKCPECGTWNSLVETVIETGTKSVKTSRGQGTAKQAKTIKLSDIKNAATKRVSTKISELDRVLGGGLVPGQVVLVAGEPGIGKSTLLLQLSENLDNVLYVCGEESVSQIKVRAMRLGIKKSGINLLENTDVDTVIDSIESPSAVIVDSIQTMTTSDLSGMAGSVGQVRECTFRLLKAAKEKNIPLFLVGHVTKEGTVAGPAVLAHIVDTVLWFEGDKTLTTRVLRAVKNRFGPTDEVGVFEMQDRGLMPVDDIEKAFLEKGVKNVSGSIATSVMQGTRPLLVEIQALVVPTKLAIPRRVAQGIDSRRLELLLAVLTRRCGLPVYDYDVFVNVAGGLKVTEPASDLSICLAVASSYFDKPVSGKVIAVGEVGLLGEVREVVAQDKRIKESKRLGFTIAITSKEVKYVGAAIKQLFR